VVIVDSTVWVDYFRGVTNSETDWLDAELERQRFGITDLILCEVLQGVRDESTAADMARQLLKLKCWKQAALTWREKRRGTVGRCVAAGTRFGKRSIASLPRCVSASWRAAYER
jgi:hypothetical protein